MAKTFLLSNGIETQVKRSRRAKNLRITVRSDGGVVLTMPFFVSFEQGERFLQSHAHWIKEKMNLWQKTPLHFLRAGSEKEYKEHKEKARHCIAERLHYFQKVYAVSFNTLSIRNQKTRWGSCSQRRNLSFSYRLLFLPERLRDYIIVHELCHLKELNHSPRFWAQVALTFPDYRQLRQELNFFSDKGKLVEG